MREGVISPRSRVAFFHDYLGKYGYSDPRLFIEISKNGSPYYAYPDLVCMAFVEYFAFEAQKNQRDCADELSPVCAAWIAAIHLSGAELRICRSLAVLQCSGIVATKRCAGWVFQHVKESAGLTVDLINAGLTVHDHTIPDGSVGSTWANHWKAIYLPTKYPAYILKKANMLPGGEVETRKLAAMYQPSAIEDHRG